LLYLVRRNRKRTYSLDLDLIKHAGQIVQARPINTLEKGMNKKGKRVLVHF